MASSQEIPIVEESKLLKVETGLNAGQVQKFFSATPPSKIKSRPAKGGGEWKYVSGSYVTQVLNSLFGFNWTFTVDTSMDEALKTAATGTVVVKGTLKVKVGDEYITREQYGRAEVKFLTEDMKDENGKIIYETYYDSYKKAEKQRPKKQRKIDPHTNQYVPLDFGNDMKAAATDAKKKCAAELGLFADVYSQEDFFEVEIIDKDARIERTEKIRETIELIKESPDEETLKTIFMGSGVMNDSDVIKAKDRRKLELKAEEIKKEKEAK